MTDSNKQNKSKFFPDLSEKGYEDDFRLPSKEEVQNKTKKSLLEKLQKAQKTKNPVKPEAASE